MKSVDISVEEGVASHCSGVRSHFTDAQVKKMKFNKM
jgi:hypothetical protein